MKIAPPAFSGLRLAWSDPGRRAERRTQNEPKPLGEGKWLRAYSRSPNQHSFRAH
jgi:hypothetical protein